MTLRSALRQSIRDELNDNGATKLLSDALLNEYIAEAIRDYSRQLPEELQATITVVADQTDYTLPTRWLQVLRVEQPKDTLRIPVTGGRSPADTGGLVDYQNRVASSGRSAYRIFGNELILDPAPTSIGADEDIRLEYTRYYAEPALDGDTLATPSTDDDVLISLACLRALTWVQGDEAKRVAHEARKGLPINQQTEIYRLRAERAVQGRTDRLRVSALQLPD